MDSRTSQRQVMREPMILLLLVAGGVYFFLGDRDEAALLLGSIGLFLAIAVTYAMGAVRIVAEARWCSRQTQSSRSATSTCCALTKPAR